MPQLPPELHCQIATTLFKQGSLSTRLLCSQFNNLFLAHLTRLPISPPLTTALLQAGADMGQVDRFVELTPGGMSSAAAVGQGKPCRQAKQLVVSLFQRQDTASLDWLQAHVFLPPEHGQCHRVFFSSKIDMAVFSCPGLTMIRYLYSIFGTEGLEPNDLWLAVRYGNLDFLQELNLPATEVEAYSSSCLGHAILYKQEHVIDWLLATYPVTVFDFDYICWTAENLPLLQRILALLLQAGKLSKCIMYRVFANAVIPVQRFLLQTLVYKAYLRSKRFKDGTLFRTYLNNRETEKLALLLKYFPANKDHFNVAHLLSATGIGKLPLIELVYDAVSPHLQVQDYKRLLHICARNGHLHVLRFFLEQSPDCFNQLSRTDLLRSRQAAHSCGHQAVSDFINSLAPPSK